MNDNESNDVGRRLICALLSTPKFILRSYCIKKDSYLVDNVGLQYLIPMRVLDIVTSLIVWVSVLNW